MDLCPLCAAPLVEIRAKAVCSGCGRIVEGCCEGAAAACGPASPATAAGARRDPGITPPDGRHART